MRIASEVPTDAHQILCCVLASNCKGAYQKEMQVGVWCAPHGYGRPSMAIVHQNTGRYLLTLVCLNYPIPSYPVSCGQITLAAVGGSKYQLLGKVAP